MADPATRIGATLADFCAFEGEPETRYGWTLEQVSAGAFRVCDAEISVDAVYARLEKSTT